MLKISLPCLAFLFLTACGFIATRPKFEMAIAQTAFMAAKTAKARSLAPNFFRKAEFYYLKAKSAYKKKYFNKAKQYAILSKEFSEKAEYIAVKKKILDNL